MAEEIKVKTEGYTPKTLTIPKSRKKLPECEQSITVVDSNSPKVPKPILFKGACVVCDGGDILEKIVLKFDPKTGPMITGPGSRGQFHYISEGFYCMNCGLRYEFVPGRRVKTSKK